MSGATMANGSPSKPNGAPPALPSIQIRTGYPHEATAAAIEALRADPDLYSRDTDLAHVTRVTSEEAKESGGALVAGSPKIHTMSLATLRVRMCKAAVWQRAKPAEDGVKLIRCEPTLLMAQELRDERHWPGIRELAGVAETPFPRPDLSIVQGEAHYDRATGYLYEPSQRYELVKADPSQRDAFASREAIEDIFVDVPFATPAGVSGVLALITTIICRPAIKGPVPAWIIDATSPGTGKTMIADVVSAIALGREAGRAHFPSTTGRDGDAEIQKRLGMLARMGMPLVCFDNADETIIGGDAFEEVISARDKYLFRILGKSEGLNLPVRMVFLVTANNATWSRGMNRRILHVRLESKLENPEKRPIDTYRHPERAGRLFEYVLEHRAELVRHVLTIVRAYAHAGCPSPITLGTFEAWARIIPSALVWAGGVSPMLCRPAESGEESQDTLQRQALAREWDSFLHASSITSITAHDMIARLYPARMTGEPNDPAWDALRGAIEFFVPAPPGRSPDPAALGTVLSKRLKHVAIRTHDAPAPLRRFVVDGKSSGRARWRVEDVEAVAAVTPIAKPTPYQELLTELGVKEAGGHP